MGKKKMTIDISPATPTKVVLRLTSKNQEAIQKVSMQIASGNKHETFEGFAEDAATEKYLKFKTTLGDIGTHIRSNDTAIAKAKTMDSSIQELQDLATDLTVLIAQRRNSASGESLPIDIQVKGILDKIAGQLNVKFDGLFLFAGSKTNTKPVVDIQTSNLDVNNAPTASYYKGDNAVPSVRSSNSEEIEYGVLANNEAFRNLIGAAHLLIAGHANNDDTILASATDLANTAVTGLTSARAIGLIAVDRMQKATASHHDFNILILNNLNEISQTDIVQATSTMSELQAIIQAGYMAFSRLSNLKLTDYLR